MIRINTELEHKGADFAAGMVIVIDIACEKQTHGNRLYVTAKEVYVSEATRQLGSSKATADHAFPAQIYGDYDRATHDVDTLIEAHNRYKQALVGIGIPEAAIEIFGL